MHQLLLKSLLAVVACATFACGPSRLSVKEMRVTAPSLMISNKSPRTAYLVLDPAKVPAVMPVLVDNTDRGGRLEDVQAFVQRDLVKVFGNYFDKVEVVAPGQPLPSTPHAVIDVKVERVEVRVAGVVGGTSVGHAAMTWGLGLKLSEENEYLFSFAGESAGTATGDVGVVFRSMFEEGIADMLRGYSDKDIHSKVLSVPSAAPTAKSTDI
ncbi:hypothetical protein [Pyxidicoccus xibeiensis]|uniref:hypothetical protein n=1 Tax=Pyxidicoccus xibeiensis TaxID=2906759 RepID=UPI0020A7F48E|nr:hypothetical protein [Pyxidicoccus xibeiensis]MCP3142798.1 hypothetical protein [Pyxidicoccus xibeiensis]